ncbi:hypothetical protein PIB30_114642, partial [Stylosanthes scabra]|nr:hypothetical protein [Stylosanthes scabra]
SAIPWTQRTSPVSDAVTGAPGGPPEAAEAPQAPQPRRTTRAVRPPPCGTGGHRHPPGGDHQS